jgi:hypothetical protein
LKPAYVLVIADTLVFGTDSAFAGQQVVSSVHLTNSQPLNEITIPFIAHDDPIDLTLDSVGFGGRTSYFESKYFLTYNMGINKYSVVLEAGGGSPPLAPGSGEVMRIYFTTDEWAVSGQYNPIDSSQDTPQALLLVSDQVSYTPVVYPGELRTIKVLRGDLNYDQNRNLADITSLIDFIYLTGTPPVTLSTADINDDGSHNLTDITKLISFVYLGGEEPVDP